MNFSLSVSIIMARIIMFSVFVICTLLYIHPRYTIELIIQIIKKNGFRKERSRGLDDDVSKFRGVWGHF